MNLLKICLVGLTLALMLNCLEAHRRQSPGRRGAMHMHMQMQMRCFDEHGHGISCFASKVSSGAVCAGGCGQEARCGLLVPAYVHNVM
jgi:hypothetical protein